MTLVYLAIAAAIGGALRFAFEYKLPPVGPRAFPRATLIVNLLGTFIFGIVSVSNGDLKLVIGTGLCGALTTFSGVSLQLHRRIIANAWTSAMAYFAVTLTGGIIFAWLGIQLGKIIF